MKKVFLVLVLLTVFLLIPTVGIGAAGEELHLLWDIPFGVPESEMLKLAQQASGIRLEKSTFIGDGEGDWTSSNEQTLTIQNVLADRVSFRASGYEEYTKKYPNPDNEWPYVNASINFKRKDIPDFEMEEGELSEQEIVQELIVDFVSLFDFCKTQYGEPTRLFYTVSNPETGESRRAKFELVEGELDREEIEKLYLIYPGLSINITFGNVELFMIMSNNLSTYSKISLAFYDEFLAYGEEDGFGNLIVYETVKDLFDPEGSPYEAEIDIGL